MSWQDHFLDLDPDEPTWLFVYGTLRPGGRLYPMLEHAVLATIDEVQTDGALFHYGESSKRRPIYPVADLEREGTVVGTLLLVRPDDIFEVRWMEIYAGYEERLIKVRAVPADVEALAYHYLLDPGEQIASGDWRQL